VVTQRKHKVTEERYNILVTSGGHLARGGNDGKATYKIPRYKIPLYTSGGHLARGGNDGKATYKIPPHIKYLLHQENISLYPYKTPMHQYYSAGLGNGIQ
jgi:hypothetical protein